MHPNHTTNDAQKLCECGCGQPAPIAKHDHKRSGHIKGQPTRFIHGHNGRASIDQLFWSKVNKRGIDECWEWTGLTNDAGYGETRHKGKTARAHRVSYEIHFGELPNNLHVCHRCDNRLCVNPSHLFLGDDADNIADMVKKGRQAKGAHHSQAKLTEQIVTEIRNLHQNQGASHEDLAAKFGVSRSAISMIISRKRWKHIA